MLNGFTFCSRVWFPLIQHSFPIAEAIAVWTIEGLYCGIVTFPDRAPQLIKNEGGQNLRCTLQFQWLCLWQLWQLPLLIARYPRTYQQNYWEVICFYFFWAWYRTMHTPPGSPLPLLPVVVHTSSSICVQSWESRELVDSIGLASVASNISRDHTIRW
jgi:hypothetical protein